MFAFTTDRPEQARGARGKWTALALALAVNLLFVGVLLTAMEVRTSHQALHYEVQTVAGLGKQQK